LTTEQKKLLEEFDQSLKEGGTRHSPREASWVDKLKSLFG
ncbi:MAG: molecular chaperone DnaJ, partial [Gammaproteobacteria bacterium]|nr:molecular chaperone DnaJ [Gammaproteobacteria bacterium]